MALQKQTMEFPIKGGLMEKVPDELLPDGFANRAENVDLRKDGSIRKRRGFSILSNAAIINNTAGTLDSNFRRLATRDSRSLVVISDEGKLLGSGGGSTGEVGSTVYERAEGYGYWVANGIIPIPTVEQVWGHSKIAQYTAPTTAIAVGAGILFCAANATYQNDTSVLVEVVDLEDSTCLQRSSSLLPGGVSLVGGAYCGFLYLFNVDGDWAKIDPLVTDSAATAGSLSHAVLAVSTDGTYIYTVHRDSGTGDLILEKFNQTLVSQGTLVLMAAAAADVAVSVDARQSTMIDVLWTSNISAEARAARVTSGLGFWWATYLVDNTGAGAWLAPRTCTVSASTTSAVGRVLHTWQADTYSHRWAIFRSAGLLGTIHDIAGEYVRCQPWMMNGHCYALSVDSNQTTDSVYDRYAATMYCIEFDVATSTQTNNWKTLLPSAAWFVDTGSTECFCTAYQADSKSYVFHGQWVDGESPDDWNVTAQVTGQFHKIRPTVTALNFSEPKRYQNVEWNGLTVFAGGVPWVYDGLHCHEATHLHWPRLTITNAAAGAGTLAVGTTYFFRSVFKYVDKSGRIYWSQPSSLGEFCSHTPTNLAVDGAIEITVSTPNICAMPQGGFNFAGSVSCEVYVSTSNEPDIFKFVSQFEVDQFHQGALPVLTVSAPAAAAETRFLYTVGGELENVAAPPGLSIENHRGRLWIAASDESKVWFSKPAQPFRGPEFCQEFQINLPAPCTALVSNEDRIIIFTKKVIYFIEGDGPGPTGVPVNGFSRLSQLYVDEGCVETNAALRTPYGIIYRGRKGFMLLTRSLELKFIGESVEDSFDQYVDTIISMSHDPRLGCAAILVVKEGIYRTFRFWYDTAQWSIDTLYSGSVEIRDAICLESDYYLALPSVGVWQSQDPVLGSVHADDGNFAQWVWETGWLRFADLHSFKRLWRVFITARSLDSNSSTDIKVEVMVDLDTDVVQTETFRLQAGETKSFRMHLKRQKVKNLKIRLTQLQGVGSVEAWGAEVLGLGFEAALKKGGTKLGRAETR